MNKKKEYTIEIEGGRVTGTIPRMSNFFGVDYETVKQRIRRGWTVEQALEIVPPEQKIIRVPISAADKIQRETVERKVPRRKKHKIVFYHCTAGSGYWDYERRDG